MMNYYQSCIKKKHCNNNISSTKHEEVNIIEHLYNKDKGIEQKIWSVNEQNKLNQQFEYNELSLFMKKVEI